MWKCVENVNNEEEEEEEDKRYTKRLQDHLNYTN